MSIKDKLISIFSKPEEITVLAFGKSRKGELQIPSVDSYSFCNQLYTHSVKYVSVEIRKDMTEDELKTALAVLFVSFGSDTDLAVLGATDRIDQFDLVKLGRERFSFNTKLKDFMSDKNTKYKLQSGHLTDPEFFKVFSRCKMNYEEVDIDDITLRRSIFMDSVCSMISGFIGKKCEYIGLSDCDEQTAIQGAVLMETLLDEDSDIEKALAFAEEHLFKISRS